MIQFLRWLFGLEQKTKEVQTPCKSFNEPRERIIAEYSNRGISPRIINRSSRREEYYPVSPEEAFSNPIYVAGFDDYMPSSSHSETSSHSDYSHGGGDYSGGGSSGSWGSDSSSYDSGSFD